jgi:signal transduction histidine kinase
LQATNDDLSSALHELKTTQVSLVESEKMASLGQLTAGVAHEINNPINFVSSNVNPLIRDFGDVKEFIDTLLENAKKEEKVDSVKINSLYEELDIAYTQQEISELLQGIKEGANRTAEIVKGLKNFSRLDEAAFKTANLEEGLDSTLILLRSNMKGEISLIKEYAGIPEVDCYAGKLNQVFMNLINNSIYAILNDPLKDQKNDSTITISTENYEDLICIKIKDNGMGMDEQTKAKLFDPFYTTKPVGDGTGLGMSITYSIINDMHNGSVEVESEKNVGTTIIIKLPKNLTK